VITPEAYWELVSELTCDWVLSVVGSGGSVHHWSVDRIVDHVQYGDPGIGRSFRALSDRWQREAIVAAIETLQTKGKLVVVGDTNRKPVYGLGCVLDELAGVLSDRIVPE